MAGYINHSAKQASVNTQGKSGRTLHDTQTRHREQQGKYRLFSCHILNTDHSYDSIEDTMSILKTAKKGQYTNNL